MSTIPSIFEYIGTTEEEIEKLLENQNQYFVNYSIRKSDGKRLRFINAPKGRYKALLESILRKVLYRFAPHKIAHGFVFGRGPKTNAEQHLGATTICKFDLKNFFNSIKSQAVVKLLYSLLLKPGYNGVLWDVSQMDCVLLGKFLCYHGKVPQGAPTSPALSNLICWKMDHKLYEFSSGIPGLTVTRYADDITVSSSTQLSKPAIDHIRAQVQSIVKNSAFELQIKKTKIRTNKARLTVTGIVVNTTLNLDAKKYGILRAQVHNYVTGKTKLTEHEVQQLRGKLAWLDQLNPTKAKPLIARLSQYHKSQVRP